MPRKKLDKPNFKLSRRKDKPNWWVTWSENGKPQRISTGTEDEAAAYQFLVDFKAGWEAPPDKEYQTVNKALDHYLEYKKEQYLLRGERVDFYKSNYRTLELALISIRPFFGRMRLDQLTRQIGRDYVEKRRKEGIIIKKGDKEERRNISNATIAKELSILNAAINHVRREGWISEVAVMQLPPSAPPREKVMSPEEVKVFLTNAKTPHIKTFSLLALHTLARKSAILQLKWQQVDMKKRLIDFNAPGRVRTNKRRAIVPINNILYATLKEALEAAQTDYVIEYGNSPVIDIKGSFNRVAEKAGMPWVTPHVMRHTGATLMALSGVPLYIIAGMMEDSIDTVTRHYAKYQPDYLREASNKLEEMYG